MLPPARISFVLMAVVCWLTARSVGEPSLQQLPLPSSFRPLIRQSGYIFTGTVLAIEHVAPLPNEMPVVRVTFHIDEAIRGVQRGQTLTIHQWAGLWTACEQYRRGQRVLLFLYPPSKLGLTSPVAGSSGQFELNARGEIPLDNNRPLVHGNESRKFANRHNRFPRAAFIEALRRAAQE